MSDPAVAAGVCRLGLSGRWLATGWDGGYRDADAAYNVSVPAGFDRTDLDDYAATRLREAGFEREGPVLLTGVDAARARCARSGPVTVLATAGLSNPARLPVDDHDSRCPAGGPDPHPTPDRDADPGPGPGTGTVNLLVATERALGDGTLATLLGTAVEAKAATLHAATGFSGTTTDAVAVGTDPAGERARFAGSGTEVGAAARRCVREAVLAGLDAASEAPPETVADADHGVVTGGRADVFRP
jgi:adenosylcobinamide hydrolase